MSCSYRDQSESSKSRAMDNKWHGHYLTAYMVMLCILLTLGHCNHWATTARQMFTQSIFTVNNWMDQNSVRACSQQAEVREAQVPLTVPENVIHSQKKRFFSSHDWRIILTCRVEAFLRFIGNLSKKPLVTIACFLQQ